MAFDGGHGEHQATKGRTWKSLCRRGVRTFAAATLSRVDGSSGWRASTIECQLYPHGHLELVALSTSTSVDKILEDMGQKKISLRRRWRNGRSERKRIKQTKYLGPGNTGKYKSQGIASEEASFCT